MCVYFIKQIFNNFFLTCLVVVGVFKMIKTNFGVQALLILLFSIVFLTFENKDEEQQSGIVYNNKIHERD